MSLVLTGITAYEFWRSAIHHDTPEFGVVPRHNFSALFLHVSATDLAHSLKNTEGTPGDVHVLVDGSYCRHPQNNIVFHCCSHPEQLPDGSFYQVGRGIYVVCPELCFVQLAASLPFLETLRAGTDLCSRYQLSPFDKVSLPECTPATSKEQIMHYIEQLPKGTPGAKRAALAARWIVEGTRSPRETSLCMLMALPTKRGGFQMPPFEANHRIDLKGAAELITRKDHLEADVFFLKSERILEYQSDEYHDTSLQIGFDFEKIGALQVLGYVVTPITTWQMSNYEALEALLLEAKKQMGLPDRNAEQHSSLRRHIHYKVLEKERLDRQKPCLDETARWRCLLPRM